MTRFRLATALVANGDVSSQSAIDTALSSLVDDTFAKSAAPNAVG